METLMVGKHCDTESWATPGTCGEVDVAERVWYAKHCGTLATWVRTEASEGHILATREVRTPELSQEETCEGGSGTSGGNGGEA